MGGELYIDRELFKISKANFTGLSEKIHNASF